MQPETTASGLHSKLVEVMQSIDWIKKGGRNTAQNYDFTRQADVVAAVRDQLIAKKVTCVPRQMDIVESRDYDSKSGGRQHFLLIRIDWQFTDAETGETLIVPSLGAGTDSGDKAPYKAMTGASKYAELLAFLIPTGDDPEKDNEPEKRARQAQRPGNGLRAPQTAPTPIRPTTAVPEPDEVDVASLHPSAGPSDVCQWRLGQGQGKPTLLCGLQPGHEGDHSWIALALSGGGRVIPPTGR